MTKTAHHSATLQVRQALWALQKEVLNSLKEQFDREVGYQAAPTEWFQVLMTAERYMWLRELTSLMADIDILTELEHIAEEDAGVARAEIEKLLIDHVEEGFGKQYRDLLMSGAGLLPLHSQLKAHLQQLPETKMEKHQTVHHRKNWQETHRQQSRKKRN
ncbi:hypothetical protein AB1A81_13095 [Bdellovibrio bacteriovorus]|uniref:Uncharacterized protein n=1 Tax=Bdellovibrio bacteriovorus (strain ATCC 15356 / DSM 50701 / NCIMB 9529 / HD100) TaxID=264462 RepID=Q6MJC8_BDEBA|nr:hypothetical protein [Bdellovibrio bacteriovorus]AHZ85341.1 hypothetical protein EP01_10380 [Bdellovibrio bacteriovorus]BEV69235.1 hypothetical protein Bb109J_c2655 [Bdellovibrio bacteriovorus]CAE80633.1 hypothetical protein predicted by Glimmer/Critica [Bdellovibrio bacteriovorus HD100]